MDSKDIKKQLESNPRSVFQVKIGKYTQSRRSSQSLGASINDAILTHEPESNRFKAQTVYFDKNTFDTRYNKGTVIRPQEVLSVIHHDVDQHMQERVESYKQYMATRNNPNT